MSRILSNPAVSGVEVKGSAKGAAAGSAVFVVFSLITGLGAALASSCCALPLALATAGIGGAWLGNFSGLIFYKGYILAAAATVLVLGWIVAIRRRVKACEIDGPCDRHSKGWLMFGALGLSTVLVGFAAASDWLEPLIVRYLLSLDGSA